MKSRVSGSRDRRATAAVELAILLPTILIPLMLGIWEMGRIVQAQQVLDNAVREGARQASTGQQTNSQVSQIILQYITDSGMSTTGATVTITNVTSGLDAASANQLDQFTISVSLPYSSVQLTTLGGTVATGTNITASTSWYSMKDLPLTISPTIPTSP